MVKFLTISQRADGVRTKHYLSWAKTARISSDPSKARWDSQSKMTPKAVTLRPLESAYVLIRDATDRTCCS